MTATTRLARKPASASMDWMDRGLCRETDRAIFFPEGRGTAIAIQTEQAKQVCNRCPVQQSCLDWALETEEDWGMWGGLSERERRDLHGRRVSRRAVGALPALEDILQNRLSEFQALRAQGLELFPIARALGTNVQTINRVVQALEEQASEQAVKAA